MVERARRERAHQVSPLLTRAVRFRFVIMKGDGSYLAVKMMPVRIAKSERLSHDSWVW
jgi:hypothetical protein